MYDFLKLYVVYHRKEKGDMALRPKIVKLAKVIAGVPGKLTKIDENAPEYYCLECVVTDEQADVAIAAGLRKPRTIEYL